LSALQLEIAAGLLGPILDEVVFVGGATVHLWLTDPSAPPARATEDVDVICEVASRAEYYRLGDKLRERGLAEAVDAPVLCRWLSSEPRLVLDVMPTDPPSWASPIPGTRRQYRRRRPSFSTRAPRSGPQPGRCWSRPSSVPGRAGAEETSCEASMSMTC